MARLVTPGKGSDDGGDRLPLSFVRSIVARVGAGQQVRRKEMIITAGPEAAQSFLSSRKEGKSLAPIRQVDHGGEIAGPSPTWPGSLVDQPSTGTSLSTFSKISLCRVEDDFNVRALCDSVPDCELHLPKLAEVRK